MNGYFYQIKVKYKINGPVYYYVLYIYIHVYCVSNCLNVYVK